MDPTHDQVVLGTAGSGKTLMAVHRALRLSNPRTQGHGRTLLVTFNRALTGYLQHLLAGRGGSLLDVRTFHQVQRGYLHHRGRFGDGQILDGPRRERAISRALDTVRQAHPNSRLLTRPPEFFLDELDWISGHGYTDEDAYLDAERVGRIDPLQRPQRRRVWEVRAAYHVERAALGRSFDWWELPTITLQELATDTDPRMYQHVVIDEGQDLPPDAIRSLKQLTGDGGTVTLFADYAQQLYGQRASWRRCGLAIQRVERFQENYRNSAGIARLAIATAALPHFTDSADLVEPTRPAVQGTKPTLYRATDTATERAVIQERALEFARTGSAAILCRTHQDLNYYIRGLTGLRRLSEDRQIWVTDTGLYVGTLHAARGLEFSAVLLPGLDARDFPHDRYVNAFGLEEAAERETRLLYVGITRAKAQLIASFVTEFTSLLPAADSGLWALVDDTQR